MNEIEFNMFKVETLKILQERNKKVANYTEMISSYQDLLMKNKKLQERNDLLERENISFKKFTADPLKIKEIQSKVQELEKELNDSLKENKNFSSKFLELFSENLKLKENNEFLNNQNITKQNRINELDEIVKKLDLENNSLKSELSNLEKNSSGYEKKNVTLTEQINLKTIENNNLVNEILRIKTEYVNKYNELIEMVEQAQKKKQAADIYFETKKSDFENIRKEYKMSDSFKDFQIMVEDVEIPKKLKSKLNAHRKNITSIKFNSFGNNLLTTGMDGFIKVWDANKGTEIGVFSGFSMACSSAIFDNTENLLIGGSLDKTIKVWSLKNNKLLSNLNSHIDYINCLSSFYSSQKFLSGGSDRCIKEWDLINMKFNRNFSCVSSCSALGVNFDDSSFFSGHFDGTVKIWSNGDKPESVLDIHDDKVNFIEIVKNENQILTSSKDYTVKLIDLRKLQAIYTINHEQLPNYCESSISISSDKKYFSIGSTKGEFYIFNLAKGEVIKAY